MKKELIIGAILEQVEDLLNDNFESIVKAMGDLAVTKDGSKAFKYPVKITATIKPAGDKTFVKSEIAYSLSYKDDSDEYTIDESKQEDLFKQEEQVEAIEEDHQVGVGPVPALEAGEDVKTWESDEAAVQVYPDWVIVKQDGIPNFKRFKHEDRIEFLSEFQNHFIAKIELTTPVEDMIVAMEVGYIGWPLVLSDPIGDKVANEPEIPFPDEPGMIGIKTTVKGGKIIVEKTDPKEKPKGPNDDGYGSDLPKETLPGPDGNGMFKSVESQEKYNEFIGIKKK